MHKLLRITTLVLCLSCAFYASKALAQETQNSPSNQEMTQAQYKQLSKIMLEGKPEDLKKLLQNGLNVNSVYKCHAPLNMAIKSLAFAFGSITTPISPDEALEKIKIIIASGADLNKEACSSIAVPPLASALHMPFQVHNLEQALQETIEAYINSGSEKCEFFNISKPCKDITQEDRDMVKYLIQQAYKSAQEGLLPYMMTTVKLLVDNGADVNAKDSANKISLHYAIILPPETNLEPLKYLIEKGANVNAQDSDGNTVLFFASGSFDKKAIKLLIDAGADTKIWNKDGLYYNEVVGKTKRTYLDPKDGKVHTKFQDYM